ncbi:MULTISPECIES: hypothetical protein [unclassified Archaeoglobus]|jgi:hypothetical protein|uniref:hypothetical protein n=1 Tax=unclassified Archaeoglobus TaxID=2643606 RepID=UPI0025BEF23A|nr:MULTISPECIES: hypothetical protein [unclassified Archaeoglobus]
MAELRQFYQVYRDAENFFKLFGLEKSIFAREPEEPPAYAKIYAAIFNVLAAESVFKGVQADNHQIRILMEDGIEVKVTRIGSCWSRAFIQVSATNMLRAAQIMDSILKEVKEVFEEDEEADVE